MRAMVLSEAKKPLELKHMPKPEPSDEQVLIKISVCAVCRTDLHVFDGELKEPNFPLILGHQIVGKVEALGSKVTTLKVGDRVGVPWLGSTCRECDLCKTGHENLCSAAQFTGYHINGGFAEYCVADAHFTFPLPHAFSDEQAAPLLCGGLIGFRALRMTESAQRIGFYGFGSAAHQLIQLVRYRKGEVYAFTRPGDIKGQEFAKSSGAIWAGSSDEEPPSLLDAALIFAPAGELVPKALGAVKKGGIVVCAGIHMSDIPSFPYDLLWHEKVLRSVANLTRKDGEEFFALAPKIPIETQIALYPLEEANTALDDLRAGKIHGSAVIQIA